MTFELELCRGLFTPRILSALMRYGRVNAPVTSPVLSILVFALFGELCWPGTGLIPPVHGRRPLSCWVLAGAAFW